MNIADIILIILLGFGAFNGYRKGFILELITIVAFVLAIMGGFKLLHVGMEYVSRVYDGFGTFLPFVAFVVIFVLIIILVNMVGSILKKIIDWTPFGVVDNLAGAVVGVIKWALAIGVIFWVIDALSFDAISNTAENSKVLPFINQIITSTGNLINTVFPSFDDFINTLKELFESFAS